MPAENINLQHPLLVLSILFSPILAHNYIDGSRGLKRGVHVQGNRVSYGNFAVDKFHRLQVSVGSSSVVSNYRECALNCVNNPPCSSFNVASSPDGAGKYRCELLNEDKYSANPGQLVSTQEYHHYSIKTPCSSLPCKNGAKCIPDYEQGDFTCTCLPGYTGKTCQTDIDECSSRPCNNGGTCIDQINGFLCVCKAGYTGEACNRNINECSSNPCQNGANCKDKVNGYACQCAAGFSGMHCETDIDECSSNPCLNGATCVDQVNGYVCNCASEYTGDECQTEISKCSSNPCQNGAVCTDQADGYTCQCATGFTGIHCETDINECSSNPCRNGAVCTDQVNGYKCQCDIEYTGVHCETVVEYPKTCTGVKNKNSSVTSIISDDFIVDPDGVGGISPFSVNCYFEGERSWTMFKHNRGPAMPLVDGYEAPGSFSSGKYTYKNTLTQIAKVTSVSVHCQQHIMYKCRKSKLMASYDGLGGPFGWWVSRDGQNQYYWGGADPGSQSCGCYKEKNCYKYPKYKCNCDSNDLTWRFDFGDLTDKAALPVTEVRLGDTGSSADDQGKYRVYYLMCDGEI